MFPFLVSSTFLYTVISLGYWLWPKRKYFVTLGIFVPLTGLINNWLKIYFSIPRPPIQYHLVPIHENLGFPSGDAMAGTVFFGILFLNTKNRYFRLFCVFMVACMMASRVYLGVHSPFDVFGGLFFGLLMLVVCHFMPLGSFLQSRWTVPILLGMLVLYPWFATVNPTLPLICAGTMLGVRLSASKIQQRQSESVEGYTVKNIVSMGISLGVLYLVSKYIPVYKTSDLLGYFSVFAKYAIISFVIFGVLPLTIPARRG